MIVLLVLIFGVLAVSAAAFAVLPVLRRRSVALEDGAAAQPRRLLLPVGAGAAVIALGLGFYTVVGQPALAIRALEGPKETDYRSLIAALARGIRQRPNDVQGWVLLARGYLAFEQFGEAVKAYERAVALAKAQQGRAPAELLAGYGMAIAFQNGGVTPEAERVFREALAQDPSNQDARYHIGFAHAQRGEVDQALRIWEPLAREASPNALWRPALMSQMAMLQARSGKAPDIAAMVQSLATRLEAQPDDLNGWLMLIRAYGVLGDRAKGAAALSRARTVFAADAQATAALAEQARQSGLQ
jgi:cytochrome c-type biogenesis protein CcmH